MIQFSIEFDTFSYHQVTRALKTDHLTVAGWHPLTHPVNPVIHAQFVQFEFIHFSSFIDIIQTQIV